MGLESRLKAFADRVDGAGWRPRLFDVCLADDRDELERLFAGGLVDRVVDTIIAQAEELLQARDPSRPTHDTSVAEVFGGRPPHEYGLWAYYPWSRRLVHVLPAYEFLAVRTDRNRNKITPPEQAALRHRRIGVVGLSVGQSVALTLALEGVGGTFRLADFDSLGLSNLNRLRAGVHDLGTAKVVLAARQMFEIDPYLEIETYPEGVHERNAEDFLTRGGRLDLLIEECDDLETKVRLREAARRQGIPVLMETSDRGVIDVERFDLEPDRPLFHGLAGPLRADDLKGLTAREKIPVILRILDAPRLSAALRASLVEVKETLSTWPQLASAVALGGAITTDVARRILLGRLSRSGRYYVDLDRLVCDGGESPLPAPDHAAGDVPPAPSRDPEPIPRPRRGDGAGVSEDEVRFIVAHGILAPSGGNCQPWRFEWSEGRLLAFHAHAGPPPTLDHAHGGAYLAFGAAAENMDLAAREIGLRAEVEPFPDPGDTDLVFRLAVTRDPGVRPEPRLFAEIPRRATNRRRGPRLPLAIEDIAALQAASRQGDVVLRLVTESDGLEALGDLIGRGDRLRFLTEELHREMMGEVRWTPEEAAVTRDGIDVATLEFPEPDRAALRLLADWEVLAELKRVGAGRALERPAHELVASAGAVGLLTAEGTGPEAYFRGGRAAQRAWLTASARGLAFQPMTSLVYLFTRLERGQGDAVTDRIRQDLEGLRREFLRWFPTCAGSVELMLFRLARAGPPATRSLRRPLDRSLVFR